MRVTLSHGLLPSLLLWAGLLWWASPLMAADISWQSPTNIRLSPDTARLTVVDKRPLSTEGGQPQVLLYLPAAAQDIHIRYDNTAPLQWSSVLVPVDKLTGDVASKRATLLDDIATVQGRIAALQARMALWATPPTTALQPDQMQARQSALDTILPPAHQELAAQQRALADLEGELSRLPVTASQSQKVTALFPAAAGKAEGILSYSYTLPNCGWIPTYVFNALPDKNLVEASLIAKIWQFSGMNWNTASITLIAQGSAQREPAPLYPWKVRTGEASFEARTAAMPRVANLRATALNDAPERDRAPLLPESAVMQDSTAFTAWELGQRPLPEGIVYVGLHSDTWHSPLLWVARPSSSPQVWLFVKHELPNIRQWPVGEAAFYLDGLSVGSALFSPKGHSATLYFGIDPRVTIINASDPRQSGKEGLIDKRKTWTWQWDFTVHNGRPAPVNVRLEEAAPQLDDKALVITYTTEPAPKQGPDHSLYWDVQVPAESQQSLKYGLTLTAPHNMKVQPGK